MAYFNFESIFKMESLRPAPVRENAHDPELKT